MGLLGVVYVPGALHGTYLCINFHILDGISPESPEQSVGSTIISTSSCREYKY